jgi:UDP-N-acetylglucosamine 3-dehydrogenase
MAETLRVALIGAGRIVELGHLPGFQKAGAQVVALCDVNQDNLASLAERFQVDRRYTDWHTMLDDGGFEAVSVCTPPSLHGEMAASSARHGYHTLVEKPMALTLDECDEMIRAARDGGVLLMIAHNQRFSWRHVIAREVLDRGDLGQPRRVHAAFTHGGPEKWSPNQSWYFNTQLAGHGAFFDLGYHKIDLLRWLLGQEVTDIHAFSATFEKPTSAEDTMVAALRFSGGALGTLQISWASRPGVEDLVSVSCARGIIHVPSAGTEPVRIHEQLPAGDVLESTHLNHAGALDPTGWFGMAAAFVDAVTGGKPSPVSGEEGKATLAAVLKTYRMLS